MGFSVFNFRNTCNELQRLVRFEIEVTFEILKQPILKTLPLD